MFDKKIEKLREELREELRKEMLKLADSREARLTRDFQEQIDFLKSQNKYLNFKLRANGDAYILNVAQRDRYAAPRVYIEYGYHGNIHTQYHYVKSSGTVTAKVVGNYIEIYDDGVLVEVLTQHDDSFVDVELDMYVKAKAYDEGPCCACEKVNTGEKENNDVQQKEN